jgi:DNA adenine methylase
MTHICTKCGKEFLRKSGLMSHQKRKTPCIKDEHSIQPSITQPSITQEIIKPILKWVGGKTQIINTIISHFPSEINNYYEPFLGGGSVLLSLLMSIQSKQITLKGHIYASDINEPLIYTYKNIQSSPNELYEYVNTLIKQYNSCDNGDINRKPSTIEEATTSKENYYYWIRSEYNKICKINPSSIECSGMFIFLNKTCFRGVYRIGPHGFNVPYGHYANPEIINKEHLNKVHKLIQPVIFSISNFITSTSMYNNDDFIYIDPPYVPENKTSFVKYTKDGFTKEHHLKLFKICNGLADKNIKYVLSNSDVPLVREEFSKEKHKIYSIICKRCIHSKNPKSQTKEVIITNI